MPKWEKLLSRMRSNPAGDWNIGDLQLVAKRFEMEYRHEGGSHCTFSHRRMPYHITPPVRRPIKPPYIRQFTAYIDEIIGLPRDQDE